MGWGMTERHVRMSEQLAGGTPLPMELWRVILEYAIDRPATIVNRFIKRMLHDLTTTVRVPRIWARHGTLIHPRRERFIEYREVRRLERQRQTALRRVGPQIALRRR